MECLVTTEKRYYINQNGDIVTTTSFGYNFWKRYLLAYDKVNVLARISRRKIINDAIKASGNKVAFKELPYYVGPLQYLSKRNKICKKIKEVCSKKQVIILRLPSIIGNKIYNYCKSNNLSFGVELIGDPDMVFEKNSVKHPFRLYFKYYFREQTKIICKNADAIAYVSRKSLETKYPAGRNAKVVEYSSIEMPNEAYRMPKQERILSSQNSITICTIGSMEQHYKGHDIVIKAIKDYSDSGKLIKLIMIGGGKYYNYYKKIAKTLNLEDSIEFTGELSGPKQVREKLDESDIFILASRTEGLPRSVIEAMARGIPCIGTKVGGMPELIPQELLVERDDHTAISKKVKYLTEDSARYEKYSKLAYETALKYSDSELNKERMSFYNFLMSKIDII